MLPHEGFPNEPQAIHSIPVVNSAPMVASQVPDSDPSLEGPNSRLKVIEQYIKQKLQKFNGHRLSIFEIREFLALLGQYERAMCKTQGMIEDLARLNPSLEAKVVKIKQDFQQLSRKKEFMFKLLQDREREEELIAEKISLEYSLIRTQKAIKTARTQSNNIAIQLHQQNRLRSFVRVRGALEGKASSINIVSNYRIQLLLNSQSRSFPVDFVFKSEAIQEEVFKEVEYLVDLSILGKQDCCLLCYGKTNSGKTHSMVGTGWQNDPQAEGVIPRSIRKIFDIINKEREQGSFFSLRIQFAEFQGRKCTPPKLELTQECVDVDNLEQALSNLKRKLKQRNVSYNGTNTMSSRSHFVICLNLVPYGLEEAKMGQIALIDLAGMEKLKNQAPYQAAYINSSLTVIGEYLKKIKRKEAYNMRDPLILSSIKRYLDCPNIVLITTLNSNDQAKNNLASMEFVQDIQSDSISPRNNKTSPRPISRTLPLPSQTPQSPYRTSQSPHRTSQSPYPQALLPSAHSRNPPKFQPQQHRITFNWKGQ